MRKKVSIEIVRSDGRRFSADGTSSGEASWGVLTIEGIGTLGIEVFSEKKAVGDGDILIGSRAKSREIDIEMLAKNPALNSILRMEASSFFSSKYSYRLYIAYNGNTRWIDGVLQGISIPSEKIRDQQKVNASFFCPDPYMKSIDSFGYDIAGTVPLWTFEEIDDPDWGEPFDSFLFAQSVDITNDGDVEAFCTVVIRATGEVKNPKFIHGNSYIRFVDTLQSEDVVEIDIEKRRVKKNGENALVKVDRTSDFVGMALDVGNNTISYDADVGESNMSVTVYYNKMYLGV